ncbi:unnamed protein product [Caenorhabditis angaria]|uniref:Cyclin-H n=1 Tax=Caenorhabditis angaria TaxID=860376 RepID=A0A9P1IDE3_9PELO|nr:unnamed protein product [Caenorhabditis angaria]
MYSTSTQKKEWTFTAEQIDDQRQEVNQKFREKYKDFVEEGEHEIFLTCQEELSMQRIVEEAALKFADKFRPSIWPSVKWTAYAYFKRLFLKWSACDNSPKLVIMACFYLAMKIDEFFVTIDEFVGNLTTGNPSQNAERILALEPEIMRELDYNLTVHCPYRPFEGHLMEMKTRMLLLNFDLESIRNDSQRFFQLALQTDALLMYPPSQIALAAVKFGLKSQGKSNDVLRDFLNKLLGVEEDAWGGGVVPDANTHVEKLLVKLEMIENTVEGGTNKLSDDAVSNLQNRAGDLSNFLLILDKRRNDKWQAEGGIGRPPGEKDEQPVDSDDE